MTFYESYNFFESKPIDRFSDVTFEIENQYIMAHRFIMSHKSSTFAQILVDCYNQTQPIVIPNIRVHIFYELLRYIYINEADLSEYNVVELMHAADAFDLPGLSSQCKSFMMHDISIMNACKYFDRLYDNQNYRSFTKELLPYVLRNFEKMDHSQEFININIKTLQFLVHYISENGLHDTNSAQIQYKLFKKVIAWAKNNCLMNFLPVSNRYIRRVLQGTERMINYNVMGPNYLQKCDNLQPGLFNKDELSNNAVNSKKWIVCTN